MYSFSEFFLSNSGLIDSDPNFVDENSHDYFYPPHGSDYRDDEDIPKSYSSVTEGRYGE